MVTMTTTEDLFADVISFLNNTLASEDLSPTANQKRLLLLQKILSRESMFSYVDMNGCHKPSNDFDSLGECYEELESSWSGSAASSNGASRNSGYSSTLPGNGKQQRFSFFFGNSLGESKNKEINKSCADTTSEFLNDFSKRNSVLSDSDNSLSPSSVKSEDSLEIMSISASAVRYSAVKCGPLFRKEKVLFVEHTKRLWVALLGTTLYVYTSEKDAKPIHNINVDEYNARPIVSSQSIKNKEFGFEIICPGKKTHQFYSNSKSEMETWITSINHSMPLPQTSVIPTPPASNGPPSSCNESLDSKSTADCNESRRISCRDLYRYENVMDNPAERELPSLPTYLHYDIPNPICRAVPSSNGHKDRLSLNLDGLIQETFYHSIDESLSDQTAKYDYPNCKDPALRHKEKFDIGYNPEDNVYYNILEHFTRAKRDKSGDANPSVDELKKVVSIQDDEKENVCHKNGISRIRQIIQKMEEINNNNNSFNKKTNSVTNNVSKLTTMTTPTKEDIYELVNTLTYVNINA